MDGALTVRAVQRRLAVCLPAARVVQPDGPLERLAEGAEPPRLIAATLLEGRQQRVRRVAAPLAAAFRGFLDGTQRSEVASYVGAVPVIVGRSAAVVRERRQRRLGTWWRPLVETRVYAPRAMLAHPAWAALGDAFGTALVDTTEGGGGEMHPFTLRDAAYHRVQGHREALERRLAERWCTHEDAPLFIDGGISGSEAVAASSCAVGVVKSHRTLYAEGEALSTILTLGVGERSSVFRITSPKRTVVASWYLRLRDPEGRDPMWGLVRVEVAHPGPESRDRIGDRADEVSRWVLAEAAPLALPDARWDKMVYGIRDCEEFLRAIG